MASDTLTHLAIMTWTKTVYFVIQSGFLKLVSLKGQSQRNPIAIRGY